MSRMARLLEWYAGRSLPVKVLLVLGGGVAAVGTGLAAAPAVGAALSAAGLGVAGGTLSGAAASSAGLAWLGGGSIAAGGAGVAGGTTIVAGLAGAAGTAASTYSSIRMHRAGERLADIGRRAAGTPVNPSGIEFE